MGFFSCAGRALLTAFFLLTAWQEFNVFGVDEHPILNAYRPKIDLLTDYVAANFGVKIPEIKIMHVVAALIALKGIGGILFVLGSSIGAYFLLLQLLVALPLSHDFYKFHYADPQFLDSFVRFAKDLAFFGALLFFLDMKNSVKQSHSGKSSKKRRSKPKAS